MVVVVVVRIMLAMGTSEGGWELTVLSLALEVAEPS
jgi:hypothetical protein